MLSVVKSFPRSKESSPQWITYTNPNLYHRDSFLSTNAHVDVYYLLTYNYIRMSTVMQKEGSPQNEEKNTHKIQTLHISVYKIMLFEIMIFSASFLISQIILTHQFTSWLSTFQPSSGLRFLESITKVLVSLDVFGVD